MCGWGLERRKLVGKSLGRMLAVSLIDETGQNFVANVSKSLGRGRDLLQCWCSRWGCVA